MAEKDITEKILLSYADVFADVVNALVFDGDQIVHADDLADQQPRAIYKADGKVREVERDVIKRWFKNDIQIAGIGIENETSQDPDMPIRVIAYDGTEYRTQLLKENIKKPRYPVITLVLYYGYTEHWKKPVRLYEAVAIPEGLKPYAADQRINLFEIAYLTDEQLSYFRSDFKIVADYFVQMQRTGNYVPSHEKIQHIEAVLQLLGVLTEDNRFEETVNQLEGSAKGGVKNMCDVLDRVEARGEIKGTIKLYRDETDLKPGEITKKIMDRFSLDKDSAEKYVEDILGTQLA